MGVVQGGEQGNPLMSMLFALGQRSSLVVTQERVTDKEKVIAFLDDICTVSRSWRVEQKRNIHVLHGKTQVWNRGG